jgi:hypothetical protein
MPPQFGELFGGYAQFEFSFNGHIYLQRAWLSSHSLNQNSPYPFPLSNLPPPVHFRQAREGANERYANFALMNVQAFTIAGDRHPDPPKIQITHYNHNTA